jgi:hypothetical protein
MRELERLERETARKIERLKRLLWSEICATGRDYPGQA